MASQMGNYNPCKQSYFTRTGEGVHFVSIFFADSMTPKKLHQKNCTEFVSHVLETLEDERLEPTRKENHQNQTSRELCSMR